MLDGGLAKWIAEGRPLTRDLPDIVPGSFEALEQPGWVVAAGEAAAADLLLDARSAERYRGDDEPIDLRAGHIPGAVNAAFAGNLTAGEVPIFRSAEELRARYASLGAERTEPIVYCGSGVMPACPRAPSPSINDASRVERPTLRITLPSSVLVAVPRIPRSDAVSVPPTSATTMAPEAEVSVKTRPRPVFVWVSPATVAVTLIP